MSGESSAPGGPLVVAIGASAGGLTALKEMLRQVPGDLGAAFVVIVHLSPDHESHLAELLQPHVSMPVTQIDEATSLRANHVFVIPPNRNLSAIDTHLRLSPLEEGRAARAPIDHFFRTLAATHDGNAIAVILSGSGSDGALGAREVKDAGGLVIVQDPAEAEYDGMVQSAIATGAVDRILPLHEIAGAVQEVARIRPRVSLPDDGEPLLPEQRTLLQRVFAHLRSRTGRDYSRYKRSTILRRIRRRMQLAGIVELDAYVDRLREDPDEVRALSDDMLITVTSFFRDPGVFTLLEQELIPELFEGHTVDDPVRVWCVGCATGEEAYSVAMLFIEEAERRGVPPAVQIFASDLHEPSLQRARTGWYLGDIAADVSADRLGRFFKVDAAGGYRIRDEVRELVVFAPHNVLGDPPFSRIDLITCRNLLIYLQRDVQRDVMELFHYSLRPGGVLLLGTSETVEDTHLFEVVDKTRCVYRPRDVPPRDPRLPVFPAVRDRSSSWPPLAEDTATSVSGGSLHLQLLEQLAPPSVLVGPDDRVVHLSPNAGRYLQQPGGGVTTNVVRLVRDELRVELRAGLHAARASGELVRTSSVSVRRDGDRSTVRLILRAATEEDHKGFVLIVFEEGGHGDPAGPSTGDGEASTGDAQTRHLRAELDATRQRLQSLVEEYETGQEEMKASNEELQSANEELRSTMEELETSKEELQSMNEELRTVNQENRHKVEELAQLSSDLQNLLAATDIATLFLDRQLRILRFTPRIGDLFNVRQTDRGRPIADLTHRLGYTTLLDDARQVLERLTPVERTIQDASGRWYLTRVLPYRSTDDRIEGVVLTFVDITTRRQVTEALHQSEQRYRLLVECAREYAIVMLDTEGLITTWNTGAERIFGHTPEQAIGRSAALLFTEEDRETGRLALELQGAEADGQANDDRWHVRRDGSRFWASGSMEAVRSDHDELIGFAKVLRDNTERKRAEEAQREFTATLEARVEERTRQVRQLARNLTVAEQEERRRISRVLHDDLQQVLYGIDMRLSLVIRSAEEQPLADKLQDVREWVQTAVAQTRALTVELSPPILRKEGLTEAVEWLTHHVEELHGLHVELHADDSFALPDEDLRVILFQAIRELLFNVKKHAGVDRATVRLEDSSGHLVVHVVDEGRGIDPLALAEPSAQGGLGLVNLQERLALLGGRLEIDAEPGRGTHVLLHAPAP